MPHVSRVKYKCKLNFKKSVCHHFEMCTIQTFDENKNKHHVELFPTWKVQECKMWEFESKDVGPDGDFECVICVLAVACEMNSNKTFFCVGQVKCRLGYGG